MTDKSSKKTPHESAWLELYTVQKSRAPQPAPTVGRGRPPRIGSLKQFHSYISETDEELLADWRDRFMRLTGRKITLGEIAGFLARICNDRFMALGLKDESVSLEELVNLLVGEEYKNSPSAGTAKSGKKMSD